MNHYTISAYKHGSDLIKGVQNIGLNANMRQIIASGSGAVDPSFVSIGKIAPEITFDTNAVKTALAKLGGINGAALSNDIFFLQKMAAGGLRAGTSSHTKVTLASGIIVPTSISVSDGEAATIGYRVVPVSADGDASPIAITTLQSLEANQDLLAELYTLGAVTINGADIDGVDKWTLDFGITLEIVNHHIYPTFAGVMSRGPSFSITTFDMDTFEDWGLEGETQGVTDSTVKLVDLVNGGLRGSSPITFTIDAGMAHYESIAGRQGGRWSGTVRITPVWDGTADIIAISGIT